MWKRLTGGTRGVAPRVSICEQHSAASVARCRSRGKSCETHCSLSKWRRPGDGTRGILLRPRAKKIGLFMTLIRFNCADSIPMTERALQRLCTVQPPASSAIVTQNVMVSLLNRAAPGLHRLALIRY